MAGPGSPEELDVLLEDAYVTRDAVAAARLFETRGVLVAGGLPAARGRAEIARLAGSWWQAGNGYLADPRRVVRIRDLALLLGDDVILVTRRGPDHAWRCAIALVSARPG